tara:strand:+ start:2813 stop:3091 length:279 start_codon:yes stop_codon:yes gene_type:complete
MKRTEALKVAGKLINGHRAKDYGDAWENHDRIAKLWSVILGIKVSVHMVYLCMLAVKISRLMQTPEHEDSWVDVCGYGALGSEGKDKDTNEA